MINILGMVFGMLSKLRHFPTPDRPWWVIQTKNTANNGLAVTGRGKLLATYEAGSAYEIEMERRSNGKAVLVTKGVYVGSSTLPLSLSPSSLFFALRRSKTRNLPRDTTK